MSQEANHRPFEINSHFFENKRDDSGLGSSLKLPELDISDKKISTSFIDRKR